jgi:hypothetical protein
LLPQKRSPDWREGEPDVPDVDRGLTGIPFIDCLHAVSVRVPEVVMEAGSLPQGVEDAGVGGEGAVGSEGIEIDEVVANNGAKILREPPDNCEVEMRAARRSQSISLFDAVSSLAGGPGKG